MAAPSKSHLWGLPVAAGVVHPVTTMDRPVQVLISVQERRRARRRAAEQGLTLSDYIAGLVRADLDSWSPDPGAPAIIPVVADDVPPDHEGIYIGEAVAERMKQTNRPG